MKYSPTRTCVVCRQKAYKQDLLRIVEQNNEFVFDESQKKELPLLPNSVAVITSKTGAVLRDIVNVSLRRYPNACIKLIPASVQGEGAYKEIVRAIELVNEKK